jgi:signal transduction histidine kinase
MKMPDKNRFTDTVSATPIQIPGLDLDHFIDQLPCGISIQDRNFRIRYANQHFKKDFGDVTGKCCYRVLKNAGNICRSCPVHQAFKDKCAHNSEQTFHLAGAESHQLMIRTSPILNGSGEVSLVIVMATQIPNRKGDRKELTSLGRSIALISHGIKNILEGLQGGSYVIDEALKDKDIELVKKGWNLVNKNIFDITDVVQNILYSSKERPLRYSFASPGQLVKDAMVLFREKAAGFNIKLKDKINPTVPKVHLDAASMCRVLNNLIWNALEACLADKQKKVHYIDVKLDFYDEDHFMFEITDNGIGMDQATQRNIFEEFFSTKGSAGTGLGLAVVDKVVNKHGGKIEVTSTPKKGTQFKIIFKLK